MSKLMGNHSFELTDAYTIDQPKAYVKILSYWEKHAPETRVIKYRSINVRGEVHLFRHGRLRFLCNTTNEVEQHWVVLRRDLRHRRLIHRRAFENKLEQKKQYHRRQKHKSHG